MNKNEAGQVFLRVILGLTFFIHGISKFQGGIGNTAGFFDSLGIPGFMAYIVAGIELIGGLAVILGLGTRIVSVLFAVIMAGAIFTAKLSAGFLGNGQAAGYELDLALLAMSVYLACTNRIALSLDNMIFNKKGSDIMKNFHQKPVTFVGEVSINVLDLDKAITFYQDIIGLQVLKKNERQAVLTTDGKTPLLTLEQPADVIPKEGRTTGLYHFALLLPTRADLSIFLRHLLQTKYPFGAADHEVSEALYITDPDGNGIEVYSDRPSTDWKWANGEVAMGTDPLDGNDLLEESNGEWSVMPAGTLMGHIHLHVSDLRNTEEFYMQGLGFTVVNRYAGALFTSTGGYHHHIGLNI